MDVQFTHSSGVATITLSDDEVRRFMASSRAIVDEMRHALLVAMQAAEREAETASKPNEHLRQVNDQLRERGRAALLAYLCAQNRVALRWAMQGARAAQR